MGRLEAHIFLTLLFSALGLLAVLILLISAQKLYQHFELKSFEQKSSKEKILKPKSLEQIYLEEMQKLRFKWVSSLLIKYLVQERIKRKLTQLEHKYFLSKLTELGCLEEFRPKACKENFFFVVPEYRLTEKGEDFCRNNRI